nr:hypothetical protein [Tanacetum cinerariifolium]
MGNELICANIDVVLEKKRGFVVVSQKWELRCLIRGVRYKVYNKARYGPFIWNFKMHSRIAFRLMRSGSRNNINVEIEEKEFKVQCTVEIDDHDNVNGGDDHGDCVTCLVEVCKDMVGAGEAYGEEKSNER